jgi:hypothetical protein
MTDRTIIRLPFAGFYGSFYSSEVDNVEEREAENLAERQDEDGIAAELRLTADEYAQILSDVTDYSSAYLDIARAYVPAFAQYLADELSINLTLEFESMKSPREYNFETDRIFAHVNAAQLQNLLDTVKQDTLAAVIRERFTSRSGFISFYSNDIAEWLEKPLADWDHNELETLLLAAMRDAGVSDDWDMSVYYDMAESELFYTVHSNAVDWDKLESRVSELREEKAEAFREEHPDYVAPEPRCTQTIEMFPDLQNSGAQ